MTRPAQGLTHVEQIAQRLAGPGRREAMGARLRAARVDMSVFERNTFVLAMDGQIVGTWGRTLKARSVMVEAHAMVALSREEVWAVEAAATALGAFYGVPATLPLE